MSEFMHDLATDSRITVRRTITQDVVMSVADFARESGETPTDVLAQMRAIGVDNWLDTYGQPRWMTAARRPTVEFARVSS